ncbi:MAG: sulfurtransferase TusA family protein [Flavobacteriaceae bacterium]
MTEQPPLVLDLRGLKCPFPVLRTRKAMEDLPSGAVLVAEATDPAARIDFPHFCNEGGHALLDYRERDGIHSFTIRKK